MISTLLSFFVGATWMTVNPRPAAEWQFVSDRTERGGESTGTVIDVTGGIEFSGALGSIPGADGEPVGFSLARIPLRVAAGAKGLRLRIESANDVVAQILVAPPLGRPAVTFQYEVALRAGLQDLQLEWSGFRATSRGKPVDGKLAPELVTSFALQITRSAQPGELRYKPILFSLRHFAISSAK